MSDQITGTTAADIADSVRGLRDRGVLRAGSPLPPVRELAATLYNAATNPLRHPEPW